MTEIRFTFPLANGLHARPASLLREACQRVAGRVRFRNRRNRTCADAQSILELVASHTLHNDPCLLEISGPQQQKAARTLRIFLSRELPHADDDMPQPAAPSIGPSWLPPVFHDDAAGIWPGVTITPGIGRGRTMRWQKSALWPRGFAAGKKDPKKELLFFKKVCLELESDLQEKAAAGKDPNAVGIITAHLAILVDPGFRERIHNGISKRKKSAGQAIAETTAHYARILEKSPSVYLQERVADLEDLAFQLAEKLYGLLPAKGRPALRAPCVLVAAALAPSELLGLERRRLCGLVLGDVGFTSHTAILARSFGIPTVALARQDLDKIVDHAELIVDGRRGVVCLKPGPALKRYYRLEEKRLRLSSRQLNLLKNEPARSADGTKLEIAANIGGTRELAGAWRSGAEGIGLFRTETLFLERDAPPGEEEQFAVYREVARSAKGRPVIIRSLDVGGDKPLPYLPLPREENPFLGCRAVRFYGKHEELIRCQLRVILRAARFGQLKVMVPMVTDLEEIRLVRRLLREAAAALRAEKIAHESAIELGIMVETPAAALSIGSLASEADFFSIGSNDLLQYIMAVDRGNAALAGLYDPLHPAFLRLLFQIAAQARKAKRWLGICGEMAGNMEYLPLLVGIGFDELSMAPASIPVVKARLAQIDSSECHALLRCALKAQDAAATRALLREFNDRGPGGTAKAVAPELVRLDSKSRTPSEAIKELCDMLELNNRIADASALEEALWKREQTFPTDLGFGFALPHAKSAAVRTASIAFLRAARPMRWSSSSQSAVRGILLIVVPEKGGDEHLRFIARLSRRLMHDDFRATLLCARTPKAAAAILSRGLELS